MAGPDVDPIEALFARGVTDGLPVVPPTAGRVMAAIAAVGRPSDEVIAEVPPRFGRATVQKVAVNAVMAGCEPRAFPIIVLTGSGFPPRTYGPPAAFPVMQRV